METTVQFEEKFVMTARQKFWSMLLMGVGALGIVISYFLYPGEEGHTRFWAALLTIAVFFQGIAMASCFFQAATYVAYGGWHTVFKRIPEAIGMFMPVTALLLLLVLLLPNLFYGHHPLYHWTDHEAVAHDPIIAGKTPYLNLPFFFIRFVFFVGILIFLSYKMRQNSLLEDLHGGLRYYQSNLTYASLFLVFFALYISVTAWDWLMSIDTHWYSTMYGWYTFSSFWVTGVAVITLVVIYLKKQGYLSLVNENHLHDLGKLMFAFSIFWTYLTFCQFMLIWYANIPEETAYFRMRYDRFMGLFYGIFVLNFLAPFLILMSRDAKRNMATLTIAAIIIIIGHFIDFYLMVYPGTVKLPQFGLVELCTLVFYSGIFLYTTFAQLGKANLVPKHHPFLQESVHHAT
ncbi:MAG: quinol:cytochrome C oxidoreductase [Chitinophagales bacterium]|nr:quinol:cytochrome C oxidoreductase [Chitinophagales bacterium]MDW8428588.1 quinol:cytochrome C oxidoreductase [Chitinophagales bacterium]